jgi:hypothetical protein
MYIKFKTCDTVIRTYFARVMCLFFVGRCDILAPWYYVLTPGMDMVDSLSTAPEADAVPALDFELITNDGESGNLWCEQCKVYKKVFCLNFRLFIYCFNAPLKNFSFIWRGHNCQLWAANFRPVFCAQGLLIRDSSDFNPHFYILTCAWESQSGLHIEKSEFSDTSWCH